MLEWNIIEAPVKFPHSCIGCLNGKGPVVQTHRKLPMELGEVYICERCAERLSRLFGYAPGKRMDELVDSAKRTELLEREVKLRGEAIAAYERQDRIYRDTVTQLENDLAAERARSKQLSERIREEAEVSLSLVGGEAA